MGGGRVGDGASAAPRPRASGCSSAACSASHAMLRLVAKAAAEPEPAGSQKHSSRQGGGCALRAAPVGSSGGCVFSFACKQKSGQSGARHPEHKRSPPAPRLMLSREWSTTPSRPIVCRSPSIYAASKHGGPPLRPRPALAGRLWAGKQPGELALASEPHTAEWRPVGSRSSGMSLARWGAPGSAGVVAGWWPRLASGLDMRPSWGKRPCDR